MVLRLREPAPERPHDRRMVAGRNAEARMPVDDPRSWGGDRDVGQQPDRKPGAYGRSGDRRNDRLRAVDDVVDEVAGFVEDAKPRFVVARDHLDEVEVSARA